MLSDKMSSLDKIISPKKKSPTLVSPSKKTSPTKMVSPRKTSPSKQIQKSKWKNFDVERVNQDGFTPSQIKTIDAEIFGAIDYYYKILNNLNYKVDVLSRTNEEALQWADTEKQLGLRIVYNDKRSAEADAGARGMTLYAGMRNLYCNSYDMMGGDSPAYAAIHELHHLMGSQTEFDVGSEAAHIGYMFEKHFNDSRCRNLRPFIIQKTKDFMYGIKHPSSRFERLFARDLALCVFLYKEYENKYVKMLRDCGFTSAQLLELRKMIRG